MKRLTKLMLGMAALVVSAPLLAAPGVADKVWRLDCGTVHANQLNMFSDTMSYTGQSKDLVASCYIIKHGDQYLLWDTGLPAAMKGAPDDKVAPMSATLRVTIVEQLAKIGLKPEQITLIGISHYHFDHTGQAASFPKARLLIGKGDADALAAGAPMADKTPLAPWFGGGTPIEPVTGDKDIFGDGSVTMLDMPGHTPGHHGLLVRLAKTGNILLSGDVAHFQENLVSDGVPTFNSNRADSLASMDRFRKLAASLKAIAIIQHDARDVTKLPAFPAGAD